MDTKFKFLNLTFNAYTLDEVLNRFQQIIDEKKSANMVFTPNAELIVRANNTPELKKIYDSTDIVTLDSWVVYYAAKFLGHPVTSPVSAANMMFKFLPIIAKNGYKVYLLGAKKEIVETVKQKLQEMQINVVGLHDGYFDKDNPKDVVDDIKNSRPDILFVAMSTPFKENFISKNKVEMNVPLSVGVGGSFDIIAGKCKHAPLWISKLGLEWFYRFVQEPRRMWKRYLVTNSIFICLWIKEIFKAKEK